MKIFAIIDNYDAERGAEAQPEMNWYEMPDSSVLRTGNPFFVPDFDPDFRVFPSICLRIGRLGKSVATKFAHRYVDAWTMCGAVIATDRLERLRNAGLPWTRAVAFDRSCLLGNLQPIDTLNLYSTFIIECDGSKIEYSPSRLQASYDSIIEKITEDNTIKTGDLLLAGLTRDGISLKPGTRLEMKTDNNLTLLGINIK